MATEQAQFYCHNCGCLTLHTRMTQDTPHLVHAIVTIFLCGCWLPVWLIHSLVIDSANSKLHFLCNRCGQPAGMMSMQPQLPPTQGQIGTSPFAAPAQSPPKKPPPSHSSVTDGWG